MKTRGFLAVTMACLLSVAPVFAETLMVKDVIGLPGKEVRILTVDSAPGAASPAHRHNGQVFVYVLSGAMIMQVQGSPPVTVGPGQTFYENPKDLHLVSKNASETVPAKFLVVMIMNKGAPATAPVQ